MSTEHNSEQEEVVTRSGGDILLHEGVVIATSNHVQVDDEKLIEIQFKNWWGMRREDNESDEVVILIQASEILPPDPSLLDVVAKAIFENDYPWEGAWEDAKASTPNGLKGAYDSAKAALDALSIRYEDN